MYAPPDFLSSGTKYVIVTIGFVPIFSLIKFNCSLSLAMTSSLNICFSSVKRAVSLIAALCPVRAANGENCAARSEAIFVGAFLKHGGAD